MTYLYPEFAAKAFNTHEAYVVVATFYDGEIVVIIGSEPERSAERIDDGIPKPYYRTEQLLSEASNVSLLSRKGHWMDTSTKLAKAKAEC